MVASVDLPASFGPSRTTRSPKRTSACAIIATSVICRSTGMMGTIPGRQGLARGYLRAASETVGAEFSYLGQGRPSAAGSLGWSGPVGPRFAAGGQPGDGVHDKRSGGRGGERV